MLKRFKLGFVFEGNRNGPEVSGGSTAVRGLEDGSSQVQGEIGDSVRADFKSLVEEFTDLGDEDWLTFNAMVAQMSRGNPAEAVVCALSLASDNPELARNFQNYLEERIGFVRPDRELLTDMHAAAEVARGVRRSANIPNPDK